MQLSALKTEASHIGWPALLLSRFAQKLFRLTGLYVASIRATPIDLVRPIPAKPDHIRLKQLNVEELTNATKQSNLDMSAGFVNEALERGDYAFGAYDGNQLVAYVWRTTQPVPANEGVEIRFNKPYSYLYKSYTLPSHRGQRLTPNLFRYADRQFMDMGFTHRCAYIDVCNVASIRSAKSMGSQHLGYAGHADWLGKKWFFHTPAVKREGISFFVS